MRGGLGNNHSATRSRTATLLWLQTSRLLSLDVYFNKYQLLKLIMTLLKINNFGYSLLPARDRQLVDLEALISPRRGDSRLLAIPNSWARVTELNSQRGNLGITSKLPYWILLYSP